MQIPCQGKNRQIRFLATLLAGSLLWGCGPKITTTLIHKDSLFEVHLQRTIGKGHQPIDAGYQHPISLSTQELDRLFKSIQIRSQPGIFQRLFSGQRREIEPAFSDEEILRMSAGFSKALASATSADRINFQLRHPRSIFAPGLTTGVLYVKNDRMEIILGNYWYTPGAGADSPYDRLENPRDTRGGQIVTIVPGPFQELQKTERSSLKNRWLLIDYKGLLASLPEPEPPTPASETSLEEKLNTLKRLRDQGLITEGDYQEKKKELLKEF